MSWCCYIKNKKRITNFSAFCYSLTPIVQPLGETEFFLDLGVEKPFASIAAICLKFGQSIQCLGISQSKFLAKALCLAPHNLSQSSPVKKLHTSPLALFIPKGLEQTAAAPLPVSVLWTLPPVVMDRLQMLGIHTLGETAALSLDTLIAKFGYLGHLLYQCIRGQDREKIQTLYPPPYLIWEQGIQDIPQQKLPELIKTGALKLTDLLEIHGFSCRKLSLRALTPGKPYTVSRQFNRPTQSRQSVALAAAVLLEKLKPAIVKAELLTLAASDLLPPQWEQLNLFNTINYSLQPAEKQQRLQEVCEHLAVKYNTTSVNLGKDLLPTRREQLLSFWDPLRVKERGEK
ncbi:hypothetical protein MFMK1_001741 [Metallumcola ferriviriculae]|uniref:UmuC domain-containing protein n=1 Tax=Metallumcola ferriviriculae TaxID=3039180 RepID=A0AAU0UP12_9FIRM|nr:hypothetical protein MFMK1_001741 [Desulfitibacteraceae bacterium MK1]